MRNKLRNMMDIRRTLLSANVFFFLLGAAQASLLPFLLIFYRRLGFTPLHVGCLISVKILVGTVAGPIWAAFSRCTQNPFYGNRELEKLSKRDDFKFKTDFLRLEDVTPPTWPPPPSPTAQTTHGAAFKCVYFWGHPGNF